MIKTKNLCHCNSQVINLNLEEMGYKKINFEDILSNIWNMEKCLRWLEWKIGVLGWHQSPTSMGKCYLKEANNGCLDFTEEHFYTFIVHSAWSVLRIQMVEKARKHHEMMARSLGPLDMRKPVRERQRSSVRPNYWTDLCGGKIRLLYFSLAGIIQWPMGKAIYFGTQNETS